jgi:hypothetical protein
MLGILNFYVGIVFLYLRTDKSCLFYTFDLITLMTLREE